MRIRLPAAALACASVAVVTASVAVLGNTDYLAAGASPEAVHAWFDSLRSDDKDARRSAIQHIVRLAADDRWAIPVLIDVINGNDAEASVYAAGALGRIGHLDDAARAAIAGLVRLLPGSKPQWQPVPLMLLSELVGPDDEDAVPVLVEMLHAWDTEKRAIAARGLARIGPAAVPLLIAQLRHGDRDARVRAVALLAGCGSESAGACDSLAATLVGAHEDVPEVYDPWLARDPVMLDALRNGRCWITGIPFATDQQVRAAAATALGDLGCESAIPALNEALADSSGDVRILAGAALRAIEDRHDRGPQSSQGQRGR